MLSFWSDTTDSESNPIYETFCSYKMCLGTQVIFRGTGRGGQTMPYEDILCGTQGSHMYVVCNESMLKYFCQLDNNCQDFIPSMFTTVSM